LLCFLRQERPADVVIRIHQRTQIVTNLQEHIVRVSPANLLNPLYFLVVLNLLRVRWATDLSELRLQIVQHTLYIARRTLDVLVELAPLLDCCNRSIRSSQ
jgi:hypothetical protein